MPFFNVAYKYNLLLVLKILSYTFYNILTDRDASINILNDHCQNRQVTFSLNTISKNIEIAELRM